MSLALCALLLAGCSLARAEAAPEPEDRWIGFYVVPSQGYVDHLADNPYVEEYGADTIDAGEFGAISFPREVLFAVEDEAGNCAFPGMETGFSLFYYETEDGERGHCTHIVSNMGEHENGVALSYTDEGNSVTLSGTVYCGPPLGVTDWDPYTDGTIWHYYRVYQRSDGRIYLDGSGDTTNGPMTKTSTRTYTHRTNGQADQEETVAVTVAVEQIPRLEKLLVTQFDAGSAVIRSDDLALREKLPEVVCEAETAWVLVEEVSGDGTVRTAYNVPEEGADPVSHQVVLLDDGGLGRTASLTIQ